ncbi:MAG: LysM peptidoglycan-binding domain-containing protein [Clostridium sp.]|nr:LysM peptidoglycan-binding domain-containing protein [Clostridium sp.]
MDIKLIPAGSGIRFTFPALPERITGKKEAKLQSFDIIAKGTVKVPRGTGTAEISWSGEFFGRSKRNEAIVRTPYWREPVECVNILNGYLNDKTVLNLIVTETWINLDVVISSFRPVAYGAFGNIKYDITLVEKKALEIYTTDELSVTVLKKTRERNDLSAESARGTYTVVSGDTLWKIAARHCGGGVNWTKLYDANAAVIEDTAKQRGMSNSDKGHWIFPGEVLTLI